MSASFKMNWNADVLQARVVQGNRAGLRAAGNYLLDESRKQVPLLTGALSRSGAVTSDDMQCAVSYDTPYAIRWHEEDAHFRRGRKKKYLEDPVNDAGVQANILKYLGSEYHF